MSEDRTPLTEQEKNGDIRRLVSDLLWDWTNHHIYSQYRKKERPYKKLPPTKKREAFHLGKILCRGIAVTQASDENPDWDAYQYDFIPAANLVRVGARPQDFVEVKALFEELLPLISEAQRSSLLYYFVALCFESKGKIRDAAVDFVIRESLVFPLGDEPLSYHWYSVWRCLLGDEQMGPPLTELQRQSLVAKVETVKKTKAARDYERHRKHHKRSTEKLKPE